jgi:hypothetical protein
MKNTLLKMKTLFAGTWAGEGFAKFPTIDNTAYTEQLEFIPDEYKDVIFFRQKTWYKNHTEKNGQTVFWDTGFIILKDNRITLQSVQVGGRIESYELTSSDDATFVFNNTAIINDAKSIRSTRIFIVEVESFYYELNMATKEAGFQNHLKARLEKVG